MNMCGGGTEGVGPLTPRFSRHAPLEVRPPRAPNELSWRTFERQKCAENGAVPRRARGVLRGGSSGPD